MIIWILFSVLMYLGAVAFVCWHWDQISYAIIEWYYNTIDDRREL